jgi:RNA polymerase sigma factor (sigma-70 family)
MSEDEIRKEQEVIERSKKNPKVFGEIYEHYFDRIYNYLYRQTDDEELAGDLCSQTFVNALNHLGKYEFRGFPFSAWLYKIAGNEVNKHYRKNKGKKVFSIEELKVKDLYGNQFDFPIAMLGDIKIFFMHYRDFKTANESWSRRLRRFNYKEPILILVQKNQ